MNVLVTGGAGYIGSVTTERLLDAGHEVTVFDNLERGHREAVDRRAAFVQGDLRDAEAIRKAVAAVRPDAVMHFAAYALVPESMKEPEKYFVNNVSGGINLVEAMRQAGTRRIVFSSTCATYGEPEKVPIVETLAQRPTNPYGESKLMFERTLGWYSQLHGMTTVFLRYFNASGATVQFGEDHEPETHLIPNILRVALGKQQKVLVFGDDYDTPDGTCIRDYIHIVDLAEAHILALAAGQSGAYNLGTGTGYSVRQVIQTARRVTGHPVPEEMRPRRPGDPPRLIASSAKAMRELGWVPRYENIEAIVESAWRWHRAHPNGYRGA
jgi:UDP-glucose 4-epimerase